MPAKGSAAATHGNSRCQASANGAARSSVSKTAQAPIKTDVRPA